jgi:hypothetical protein
MWDQLPLLFFFVCSLLGAVSIALLALSSLIIGLPIGHWLIVANIEDQISSSGRKNWKREKPGGYGGRFIS